MLSPYKLKWMKRGEYYESAGIGIYGKPTYRIKKLKTGWGVYKYNEYTNRYGTVFAGNFIYPAQTLSGAKQIAEYDYTSEYVYGREPY